MSIIYRPINGLAGTATFTLRLRFSSTHDIVNQATIEYATFDEEDVDSDFTEIFTNIEDNLVKDFYGYRKVVRFSMFNKARPDVDESQILPVISIINSINNAPDLYRLTIQYRSLADYGTINDALFVGNFKLLEASAKGNAGQIIPLEFMGKGTSMYLNYGDDFEISYILLENGGKILLEDGTSGAIVAEGIYHGSGIPEIEI
ncbi:MAG: hypothetical protein RBT65_09860 [Methanolobus sp.]|nr:hypothetical protein [Methanolobus sp.]